MLRIQRELGIIWDCNVENVIFANYGQKKQRKKKQQKEIEKQQHVIVTENNLFEGFTTKGVRNYDQMYSGKLDSGVAWNSSRCRRFLDGRSAAPSTIIVKLAGLLSIIIKSIESHRNVTSSLRIMVSRRRSNRKK